jgi:hypothetical protein
MKAAELALSRASRTCHALPKPQHCPNVSSSAIADHHPVVVKGTPFPLGIAGNLFLPQF